MQEIKSTNRTIRNPLSPRIPDVNKVALKTSVNLIKIFSGDPITKGRRKRKRRSEDNFTTDMPPQIQDNSPRVLTSQEEKRMIEASNNGGKEEQRTTTYKPTPILTQKVSTTLEDENVTTTEDNDKDVNMTQEIYEEISKPFRRNQDKIIDLIDHKWVEGTFRVVWDTEQISFEEFKDLKNDYPRYLALYIINDKVSRSKRDRNTAWAREILRDLDRAIRRLARLYYFFLDDNDNVVRVRRVQNRKKEKLFD